jgi:predicted dehydrogenase
MGDNVEKLRVGIVGLGRISPAHIRAVQASDDIAELVAFVSRRADVAAEAARRHGVAHVFADLETALGAGGLDAVVLCTPNHVHPAEAVAAADAGCHVLVEKPLANTVAEADAMIEAADRNGVVLMAAQCRRFTAAAVEAHRRVAESGAPYSIVHSLSVAFPGALTDWWPSAEKTGGLVLGLNGAHVVDTILWLMGARPTAVRATSSHHNAEWEGEDEAAILMDFPDGGMAVGHLSVNASHPINERFIVGDGVTMRMSDDTRLEVNGELVVDETYGPYLDGGPNFDAQTREFLLAAREGRTPIASGAEVRACVEVLEAAREAIRTGGTVALAPAASSVG